MTVISGHQRLKASKELGIRLVPIMIRDDLTDENEKLKLLLAANFGRTKNDDAKQRKIATEYVALCGNSHGGDRVSSSDNRNLLTQNEIASQLGVSVTTLNEMLAIERKLTPEIKELLDSGIFTKTTASKILTKLSADEQAELAKILPHNSSLTQNEVNEYVEQIKTKDNQIAGYEVKLKRIDELKAKINSLEAELLDRPVKTVEVKPDDYDALVKTNKEALKDNARLSDEYHKKCVELVELKEQLKTMTDAKAENMHQTKIIDDSIFFCERIDRFIKEVGGYAYLCDYINDLPDKEKKNYRRAVELVTAWAKNILLAMN